MPLIINMGSVPDPDDVIYATFKISIEDPTIKIVYSDPWPDDFICPECYAYWRCEHVKDDLPTGTFVDERSSKFYLDEDQKRFIYDDLMEAMYGPDPVIVWEREQAKIELVRRMTGAVKRASVALNRFIEVDFDKGIKNLMQAVNDYEDERSKARRRSHDDLVKKKRSLKSYRRLPR